MIEVLAPAKLNLGLEVLGRRADGYHEIRTVMTTVSLVDRLRLEPAGEDRLSIGGLAAPAHGNIVADALAVARGGWDLPPIAVTLSKRIPLAAGLGGGSSDAAAALAAAARLGGRDGPPPALAELACRLGSDVPFFLTGGSALVSGRGEVVVPAAPHPPLHAVVVVPRIAIPRKTARMYALLTGDDLSDGSRVDEVAATLDDLPGRREPLPNAFRRPLYEEVPGLRELARTVEAAASLPVQLSGSGPAHYVVCADAAHASCISHRLRAMIRRGTASVFAVRSISGLRVGGETHAARDA